MRGIQVNHACTLSISIPPYTQPQYTWNGALEIINGTAGFNAIETFYNNTTPACTAGSLSYYIRFERSRAAYCAYGQGTDGISYCALGTVYPDKNRGGGNCSTASTFVGNPINASTGNKFASEADYVGSGPFPLEFIRYYNSATNIQHSSNPSSQVGPPWRMGYGWHHNYERQIDFVSLAGLSTAFAYRPDGKVFYFTLQNGSFVSDADISVRLIRRTDSVGNTTGWQYTNSLNEQIESYGASGKLLSIQDRAGFTQTILYDSYDRIKTVTDSQGRQLVFTYDLNSLRLSSVKDPSWNLYLFSYLNGQLQSVTYPNTHSRTYVYDEAQFVNSNGLLNQLTGITDENSVRYATYQYQADGKAISTGHAAGADLHTLAYNADGSTTVTDPLGTARTYNFSTVLGVVKSTGSTQPGGSGCAAASVSTTYDANGNIATRTDFNGNTSTYSYDLARNLETSRTEALGRPEARTITTAWHPTYRLPTKITEPGRVTDNTYDPNSGNLLSRSITDVSSGKVRTWTYTYTTTADNTLANLLKTVDGPRTDVIDITRYTYYPNGDLQSITNALGHTTRITQHDPNGRPQIVVDPNNIATALSYTPRGWLASRTVAGEATTYAYDGVGQIKKITFPDLSFVSYDYDDAHRLTDIHDTLGNRIHYTLDNIGNRTKEEIFTNTGTLTTTKSRQFDALNRLWKDIGALNQTTTFEYDANGNLTKIDGPLTTQNDITKNTYDALNRLSTSTDGLNGITRYGYDPLDQLRSVTDPKSLTTGYSVNALGEQTRLSSPDTGVTNSSYDAAGNLINKIDADNRPVTYSYDALNRVTSVSYDGAIAYTFSYDQGPNALGKLTTLTGGAGDINYTYNPQGRIATRSQNAGLAGNLTTRYGYNGAGQLTSITYPSGKLVQYGYNANGQLNSIIADRQPVLQSARYQPFGPVAGWTWGNNAPYQRQFDSDGRLFSYPLANNSRVLGFDTASRITNSTDTSSGNTLYSYDELDRLKTWQPPNTNQSYYYDANGNRVSLVIGGNSYSNSISPTSNQLQSVAGPSAKTYSYNNSGNRTNDGLNSFGYNAAQRLSSVTNSAGTIRYTLNALGQRSLKSGPNARNFVYDEAGHLMGEYDLNGHLIEETVYLGDLPVAVLR